jgi:uncharacterized secreted protein with C-terminal beta-propeller domain
MLGNINREEGEVKMMTALVRRAFYCLLLIVLSASCSLNSDSGFCDSLPVPGECDLAQIEASLTMITGCDQAIAALKQSAYEEMQRRLAANLKMALEYGLYYDCGGGMYGSADLGGGSDGRYGGSAGYYESPGLTEPQEGAGDYSTTNTQEAGVDEADLVKNDDNYIYVLAGDGLTIIDAWPAPETRVLSSYPIEGVPIRLFVYEDRAVVYSDIQTSDAMKVTVLNITDRASPVLEREIRFSGAYLNSRRIGSAVFTVVTHPEIRFKGLRYWPDDAYWCSSSPFGEFERDTEIRSAFLDLLSRNRAIIEQADLESALPRVSDTIHLPDGQILTREDPLQDCSNFYQPSLSAGEGFLTVASLDVRSHDLQLASIVGRQGVVYASHESLYVANTHFYGAASAWFFEDSAGIYEATALHKFSLSTTPPAAEYVASGAVEGRVLNQFSLGEYNRHLRLATTNGQAWGRDTHNSVFVLEQQGNRLETIGSITGIAPTEDIRSARFVGERGFIVTFKKTDPLFTVDLSDPRNPVLAGELKIPGFSTYIHMMDADHLLTIGFDADDEGSFGWFQGIELQVFDVSDMSNPTQMHKEIIGTRGSSSEATANHLAFNYFPPKDLLALPMVICEGGSGGNYGDQMTFNGLLVYDVTAESGFYERGRVPHGHSTTDSSECYSWWTDPGSRVKRSIIMDDYIFSISDTLLKVNHLDFLEEDTVVLELPPIPSE